MNRVIHFKLHANDTERSIKFYQEVFGWKWSDQEDYWLVQTGAHENSGIDNGFVKSRDQQPRTVNSIQVASIDEYADKITKHGGSVVVSKMGISDIGYVAYCLDTEGNIFGIFENQ